MYASMYDLRAWLRRLFHGTLREIGGMRPTERREYRFAREWLAKSRRWCQAHRDMIRELAPDEVVLVSQHVDEALDEEPLAPTEDERAGVFAGTTRTHCPVCTLWSTTWAATPCSVPSHDRPSRRQN